MNYPNNADCVRYLHSQTDSSGVHFKIYILQLSLEANYDFLKLGYGSDVTDDTTVVQLTSTESPNSVIIYDSTMWIRFISDWSGKRLGFVLYIELTSNNITGTI